jgi:hypothetical protein
VNSTSSLFVPLEAEVHAVQTVNVHSHVMDLTPNAKSGGTNTYRVIHSSGGWLSQKGLGQMKRTKKK